MKFNWGTGIFLFLVLFVILAVVFVVFTVRQGVNLENKDYYEKGADYTQQMEINKRSAIYEPLILLTEKTDSILLAFPDSLVGKIDSGNAVFYRPSDMNWDVEHKLTPKQTQFNYPKNNLRNGRYILKVNWFKGKEQYEVKKSVIIHK